MPLWLVTSRVVQCSLLDSLVVEGRAVGGLMTEEYVLELGPLQPISLATLKRQVATREFRAALLEG